MMITEMLPAGVDPRTVMGRAGHSSEATTMTVYAKVRPAIDSAAAEMWAGCSKPSSTSCGPEGLTEPQRRPMGATCRAGDGK